MKFDNILSCASYSRHITKFAKILFIRFDYPYQGVPPEALEAFLEPSSYNAQSQLTTLR
jgi:hypothetical protein